MPQSPHYLARSGKPSVLRYFKAPKIVRRFKSDDEGVTAIEFAMLAFPFFALMMAIVESSILFFAGQVLESSVDEIGRKIRTGQLDQTLTEEQLRDEICDASAVLFDCDDILIDMQVVSTFDDLGDMPEPVDGALDPSQFDFTAAGPRQIVMLTVVTEWPIYTNYLEQSLSDLANGNSMLTAVTVFQTEPFS